MGSAKGFASEMVTVDNFVRAESDMTLARYVKQGALGKLLHLRQPAPIEKQDVIRMNRDTLYSIGVFDLSTPVTMVKPASPGRFQSMLVINEDHSMLPVEHDAGEFTFTQEQIGTRYVFVIFRTLVDANSPADIKAANALQDKIAMRQENPGKFEIPDWDEPSLKRVRDAINVLAATRTSAKGMFGDKAKLQPISQLLGTAFGWGGNPEEAAAYDNAVPTKNDGKTPYRVTVKDVPVDGFWSITVYNKDGFMERNDQNVYSFNNVTARKNAGGSITINFGGGPEAINNLPITPGWSYIVRMYQPRPEIINGSWSFPKAQPVSVPGDGEGAVSKRCDNMNKTRFLEIFLAHRDAKTGKLVAECYNTMFSSKGIPGSRDTAPQVNVESLDVAAIKTEYGVTGASLNGPKLWLPDWLEAEVGVERIFNGISAAWCAQLNLGDNAGGVGESTPYKPMSIARKSGIGWNKGTTVMLLDDAEGNTWIMKGFQQGLKPQHTYEQFVAAGANNFKKLPPGWQFRVKTLDKDYIEIPETGVAAIMPDEFFNIYDKAGPGMSNYRP